MACLILITLFFKASTPFPFSNLSSKTTSSENEFLKSYPGDGGCKGKGAEVTGLIGVSEIDENRQCTWGIVLSFREGTGVRNAFRIREMGRIFTRMIRRRFLCNLFCH